MATATEVVRVGVIAMAINLSKIASGALDMLASIDDNWFTDSDPAPAAVSDFTAVLAYTDDFGKIHVVTTLYTKQHSAVCVDSIVHGLLSQVTIELRDVRQYTVVINPTQFAGQDEWVSREIERRRLVNSVCTNV